MTDACSNCKFWQALGMEEGICRRYPPTRDRDIEIKKHEWRNRPELFEYPITWDCMWCGEHKPK